MTITNLEECLNKYGELGYELVCFYRMPDGKEAVIFKKPNGFIKTMIQ
jgi:hypothetical protein